MNKQTSVPTADFSKRNVWRLRSGELGVRGGLYRVFTTAAGRVVKSFSVQSQSTDEPWHYVITQDYGASAIVTVYDENFTVVQSFNTASTSDVLAVTYALVEGQLVISSPSFATLISDIGDVLSFATKGASLIPGRVTLDIPRGICVGWAGRLAIASKEGLYLSDSLQPTVFDPVNVLDPPGGDVFGIHVSAGGALVIATTEGVWGLPEDAASSADVYGVFSQLTTTRVYAYNTTCNSADGPLYALTERGYRRIDTDSTAEVYCNEQITAAPDATWTPVSVPDFRAGRIHAGAKGPILAVAGKTLMADTAGQFQTWWSFADGLGYDLEISGVMQDSDGMEFYTLSDGVWVYGASEDVSIGTVSNSATLFGKQPTRPVASQVVRAVDFATDAGISLFMSVPLGTYSFATLPQPAIVIGTGSWGDTYQEPLLRSRRGNFAQRLDELDVLVRVTGPLARLGSSIDLMLKGPGKYRRTG